MTVLPRLRTLAVLLGIALLVVTFGVAAPANAKEKLPVPYGFLLNAVIAGANFNADPPGANDWECEPTASHPDPVVLVHGLTGNKNTNWQTFSPLLANNGYCVFALTYGVYPGTGFPLNQFGGLTRMEASAAELSDFVDRVLEATGATEVNILGHSEGTVVPNYYAKFLSGASKIDKYVSIAPLWHGTNPLGLATLTSIGRMLGFAPFIEGAFNPVFASGPQLLSGSPFFDKLRSGGTPVVEGVEYTNIVTRYDELVQPYTSGIQAGMTNHVVQDFCPIDFSEHFSIVADPVAADLVLNALDPSHPRPVRCQLVLPLL